MNKTILDNLQATIGPLIEHSPLKDVEQNIRALLTQAITRLDVVSMEDFEIQKLKLANMQKTLVALEKRITELENQLNDHQTPYKNR